VSDSRFSGPSGGRPSSDDPYGYYGGTPREGGSSSFGSPAAGSPSGPAPAPGSYGAPPAYGTPPAYRAPSAFGGPSTFGSAPVFGQPAYPAPPIGRRSKLSKSGVATVLFAIGVVAFVYAGWTVYQNQQQALNVPGSLGGLSRDTDPGVANEIQQLQTQLRQNQYDGISTIKIQGYGSAATHHLVFLALARANKTIDVGGFQQGLYAHQASTVPIPVGSSMCSPSTDGALAICDRIDGNLIIVVFDAGNGIGVAEAAAMVDEARAAQP
jgi:hypothetical protein